MKVDQYITKLIIAQSLPVSIVDCEEFRDLTYCLDPRYELPSVHRMRNILIPANAERIRSNIKRALQSISKLNISSDIWSEPSLRAFVAFGAHGIDAEWRLIKCTIGVKRLVGSHTNELICEEFVKLAKEYGIEDNLYKVITDGSSSMAKSFDENHLTEYCSMFNDLVDDIELEEDLQACKLPIFKLHCSYSFNKFVCFFVI